MSEYTFEKTNLIYIVDYDYDRSGCTCNDYICRCTTITHTWIDNINICEVIDDLYRKYAISENEIDKYCFDRICYVFKIYDKDNYYVETGAGYYGEEIYGVWFENEEKIVNAYNGLCKLNTNLEKIQYCLTLEYGYLIDCVKSATSASVVQVSPIEIHLPQNEYFKKVNDEICDEYKNRELPIGVCVKHENQYRLIDGYHRFVANKNRNNVYIVALE